VVAALGILAGVGCTSKQPLANTFNSPEALASAVLEAVQTGDRARLNALALNEQEFKEHVWPDLPAARPERNLPFSYVWGDLRQKSDLALSGTLKSQAGRRQELRAVTFADVTPYAHFRVHRKATFHVADAAGAKTEIQVCGSMLEEGGAWKVFSYVID